MRSAAATAAATTAPALEPNEVPDGKFGGPASGVVDTVEAVEVATTPLKQCCCCS